MVESCAEYEGDFGDEGAGDGCWVGEIHFDFGMECKLEDGRGG